MYGVYARAHTKRKRGKEREMETETMYTGDNDITLNEISRNEPYNLHLIGLNSLQISRKIPSNNYILNVSLFAFFHFIDI